jgi:HAE1 family hydrophobic/amphiphilic exporter-1
VRSNRRPAPPVTIAALVLAAVLTPLGAAAAEHPLSLEEAIGRALDKNESIFIERRSLDAAEAGVEGAQGAYDPLLGVNAGWRETTSPIASAFSGAPPGEKAPTDEAYDAGASLGQLLPTGGALSLRASTARTESNSSFDLLTPIYDTLLGFELRQPLLRDRAIDSARLNIRVAAIDRDRAAASLRREVAETVAAVERAYWTLTAARREVEVRQEALELADQQLSETRIRIDNGVAPETEVSQPQAELERRRGELLQGREAVARAENDLKVLILADADGPLWADRLVPTDTVELAPVELDVNEAMARALVQRAEVESAEAVVDRRRAESAFARDRIKPALDAVISYDRFGLAGTRNPALAPIPGLPSEVPGGLEGDLGQSFQVLGDGDFDDTRIGLELAIPIGNRQARAGARIAEDVVQQAQADLERVRKAIRAEVLNAAAALDTAGQRIESARSARQAAEVQLSSERERFGVGLSTNFLVLTRQNDLASARLAEIEALTDYQTARTELARATGSLLADRGIELETE